MTVIRLPDGGLSLHSEVEGDAATRAAIERVLLRGAPSMNEIAFFPSASRAMRGSIDRVLDRDFDRVSVTQDEVLERGGNTALAKAYAWL